MTDNQLYGVFIKLRGVPVLIVGGGTVAVRKVETLRAAGARITVVGRELQDTLKAGRISGRYQFYSRSFRQRDLCGKRLVFCCTDDRQRNKSIAFLCRRRGILVNVADNPQLSTFYVPSTLSRGPLVIGISTSGNSPLLARLVKDLLDRYLSPNFEELTNLLGELRQAARLLPANERRALWRRLLTAELISQVQDGELQFRAAVSAEIEKLVTMNNE
jgi:precorrin-2 dehydrogenase/sirohydrochlorin ferrochelatase